jgi:hypothetical protein
MNQIKIALATLLVTAGLVASLAFQSKNVNIVDLQYNHIKRTIQTGQPTSIVPANLTADANSDNTPDFWFPATTSHTSTGTKLAYIEYDRDLIQFTKDAAQSVKNYYLTNSTLPADGSSFTDNGNTITVFRN